MEDLTLDLVGRMRELVDLDGISGALSWDEETQLPPKGFAARGRQNATLSAIRHQRLVDPALGDAIDATLARHSAPPELVMAARRLKARRDRAVKLPEPLVKAIAEKKSVASGVWREARRSASFAAFRPELKDIVELSKERADALRVGTHLACRYDALLDEFEPEMTVQRLGPVLAELEEGLVPLVSAILGRPRPNRRFLEDPSSFPADTQWSFGMALLADLGFDLERGRQDRSTHPFTETLSEHDIRLTTRIEADPLSAIFSTVHEAGHGMFEQGFDPGHYGTSLAAAPSLGIHESQSRLWENQVARSRAFWTHYLPKMQNAFPALEAVSIDSFYAAVNTVERGYIRVESDEVTYNLHILVRFAVERALVDGGLDVDDVPSLWNEKMRSFLGLDPPNDALGCLQDVHWSTFAIGYFPTYTIGNLYSAQLMDAYSRSRTDPSSDFARGDFKPLLSWLREHVHRKGYLMSADETVRAATGEGLSVRPFLDYLRKKYGELYSL
ncbi:MAG: carboxypeptidase M32 [Deltaproteobacteria bacterium]|nr:carboxypeptidase M32 [Deltaproteobacteria bacterium]